MTLKMKQELKGQIMLDNTTYNYNRIKKKISVEISMSPGGAKLKGITVALMFCISIVL